ncbi:MAG TPA: Uma2 family endonuclease [Phycisphaerae bacterium]|jgi:Uma2 family endonuclease|nr:Uma2 family endonuclease [Phycisphaerae bacterium]
MTTTGTMSSATDDDVPHHRFTREQYYQMADAGYFEGKRVELINGEILDMAAQKNSHVLGVSLATEALSKAFGQGFWIRVQAPLNLADDSDPEPDVAIVAGRMRDYTAHPQSALLVVEVSDTTLRLDRRDKAALYAAADIRDYWIINLIDNCVEILRDPAPDALFPRTHRYTTRAIFRAGDAVSPLAAPAAQIPVADLLP